MMDAAPHSCGIFSPSYKLPKIVIVTTLLLFGHVMLLCGTFLCICLSEGPVQLSDYMTDTPSISKALASPFTLVRFANNMALTLPPEAEKHQSEISPLAASETFTQRRRQRIGAESPHANSSVNGATDFLLSVLRCNND